MAIPFMPWVHAWFMRIRVLFWNLAICDAAFYHVLGFQAAALGQGREYYFHKVRALRHFHRSLNLALTTAKDDAISPPASIMTAVLFLFQTTHQNEMEEARSHMAALERMTNQITMHNLDPAGWFCINSVISNYVSATSCFPPLPHDIHPACRLPQNLKTKILATSWRQADHVVSHFPEYVFTGIDSATLRDIFQL